jgi:hypothetical protein
VAVDLPYTRQGNGMLRIQKKGNGDVVFALSGQLDKENLGELEALIGTEGNDRSIISTSRI